MPLYYEYRTSFSKQFFVSPNVYRLKQKSKKSIASGESLIFSQYGDGDHDDSVNMNIQVLDYIVNKWSKIQVWN